MSRRDDVIKVLNGKRPEYVPWFGDLAYWLTYLERENKIPEQYRKLGQGEAEVSSGLTDQGLQKLHRDLEVGFYLQAYFPFDTIYHNVRIEKTETDKERIICYETPYGTLREREVWAPASYSMAPVEHLIKTAQDMKAFRYIYENIEYRPNYGLAEERLTSVGDNGIVLAYTPKTPMMELVALKAGLETIVTELMAEEPEEFEELLDCMLKKHEMAAQIAIDSPAEYIFVPENMSSDMVGGSIYDNYIREVHEEWTGRIRKAGKKSMVHLDGTLNPLLGKLSYAGFDVVEAVTPAPVGDIALEELRSYVKEETIIWGGMPAGFFSPVYSDEEFDTWTKHVLEFMKKDNRFVLGVADEVVPGATFERIRRVSKLVEKYGKV